MVPLVVVLHPLQLIARRDLSVPIDISRSHHGDMIDDPPHVAPVDLVHAVLHMRRQQSYRGSREESE
jgi:hypothetical protein